MVTFYDLVEIAIVGAARRAGVGMPALRMALASADQIYGVRRPMLVRRFQTDGRSIFIADPDQPKVLVNLSRHGQTAWRFVREVLKSLDYEDDMVSRFWPAGRKRPILIDPQISFGQPIIDGAGIPTRLIAARFKAREPLEAVASDLSVSIGAAEDAVRFEGTFPSLAA